MFRKVIEVVCIVCIGVPFLVIGYLASFAANGVVTGFNLSKRVPK